jgi:hypothetical protein
MKIGGLYQVIHQCGRDKYCDVALYSVEILDDEECVTGIAGFLKTDMTVLVLSENEECFNYVKVITEFGDIRWIENEEFECLKQVS